MKVLFNKCSRCFMMNLVPPSLVFDELMRFWWFLVPLWRAFLISFWRLIKRCYSIKFWRFWNSFFNLVLIIVVVWFGVHLLKIGIDERKNSNNNSLDLIKLISVNSDDRIKIIIGYAFDTIINYTSPTLQIHDDATCMLNFLNEMCQSIWISPDNYSRRETLLGILSTQYNNLPKLEHKIYFLKKIK